MPVKKVMSWEGDKQRWVKMYKGVRYRVTCEELKVLVPTEEGSRKAANEWWERKLASLTGPTPRQAIIQQLQGVPIETLARMSDEGLAARIVMGMGPLATVTTADVDEAVGIGDLGEDETRRVELLSKVVAPVFESRATPIDRTIGHWFESFVATRQEQARAGSRSADGADNIRICLTHFTAFVGAANDIDRITSTVWDRWFDHCEGKVSERERGADDTKEGWSADYAAKCYGVSKTFLQWLHTTEERFNLPRSFTTRRTFSRPDADPVNFTKDEVTTLLTKATGQLKLHLLLMLQCGMTQKDISDLRKSQVDLEKGYIRRRRSKTARMKNTPMVKYKLWPETVALLKKYWSSDATVALQTESKRSWVRKEMLPTGRLKKSDNVATNFQHLRRKTGITKSLKVFRKTGATALKRSLKYRDLRHYFLGHSARNMADRHYTPESQRLLNRAIAWLRKVFKIEELNIGN